MISNKQLSEVLDALIDKGVYFTWINCNNCKKQEFVFIPRGIAIETYRMDKICNRCGCFMDGGDK